MLVRVVGVPDISRINVALSPDMFGKEVATRREVLTIWTSKSCDTFVSFSVVPVLTRQRRKSAVADIAAVPSLRHDETDVGAH